MKKIALVYGLIAGAILCTNMIVLVTMLCNNKDFEGNAVVGYTIMIVTFSLIFFGIRSYRNKELNGVISFGRAFKLGLYIMLIAATLYVVTWIIGYYLFVPDFMDRYTEHMIADASRNGQDVAVVTRDMEEFKAMYKNPVFVVLITYAEVVPVGLLVTLVSALILKRKAKPAEVA
ncbi:MAG: DUF4199 domain-containing protein [Bacteroidia bacterium]|jgi:hypothetical protein|nr:DUF4199 domain-containing protein [Bacteroidia bacterium]